MTEASARAPRRKGGGKSASPSKRTIDLAAYADDPVGFCREVLGDHLWSRQAEIAAAVRDNRRVAVPSCHGAGKSFLAARLCAWWIATRPPGEAFVVTSAPTFAQVRAILWREIGRAHRAGKLPGKVTMTEWRIGQEMVGFGRKPADMDMTGFQGIHARRVLVVFDEACGIPKPLWDAAETLVTNDDSRLFAIGNPDDPASEFAKVCTPGSGFVKIHIDALKTPNLTGEEVPDELRPLLVGALWVEEMKGRWGEDSPIYRAKIGGEFPEEGTDGLFPPRLLKKAVAAEVETTGVLELGIDVARFGRDETVVALRRGDGVEILYAGRKEDTMATCGRIVAAMRETGATIAKVDDAGVGGGVTDRLREQGIAVMPVNVGTAPIERERFANLRAELFWNLRERMETGELCLPNDERLLSQLAMLRYAYDSRGRIKVESKDSLRRRGQDSPDRADAVMLAFAVSPPPSNGPRVRRL
ncbi:hypothetical protein ACFSM5_15600 [Lacibacterium aquatile]|uniref:Terminase n=1 Tax=Lacibacterium aquatile TaxID=1168082 RepID=A0ABW5DT64_9PROT